MKLLLSSQLIGTQEADQYIKNICSAYGWSEFPFAKPKTQINPTSYKDYKTLIHDLIASIKKSSKKVVAQKNAEISENPIIITSVYSCNSLDSPIRIEDENDEQINDDDTGAQIENKNEDNPRKTFETNRNMETKNDSSDDDLETSMSNEDDFNAVDISDYNHSLQHFKDGFDRICKMNVMMKKRLIRTEKKHEVYVTTLEEINTKLMTEAKQMRLNIKSKR